MRLIKMLGLAMVAAIASMAFVGVGSAGAVTHPKTWFCLKNEPLLCAPGNLIVPPENGYALLLAHSENAELVNNAFFKSAEKCKSDAADKVLGKEEMAGSVVNGELTELTFSSCTGPCTTAEAKGLPWKGELKMEKEGATEPWQLVSKEGGARLSGCTFGTECEYGVPIGGSVTLKGTDGTEGGVLKAEGVTLEYKAGSGQFTCGSTGTWTAEYKAKEAHLRKLDGTDVGLHTSWWFTLLE